MLLPLKAIITSKPRKDGNFVIYFQFCYSSKKRVLVNTEIAIPRAFWNGKRQSISKLLPSEYGNYELLTSELVRMKQVIETIIGHGKKSDVENIGIYLKATFTPTFDISNLQSTDNAQQFIKKEPNLFSELQSYMEAQEKKVCVKGMCNYISLRDHLLAFQKHQKQPLTFKCIDYNFYLEFVEYLMYDYQLPRKKEPTFGLKRNTIGRTIKQLRVFIQDRVKRKIIPYINLDDFKILEEESDAIYLTYEEIGRIYAYDLSTNPTFALYRDIFVLGCLTGMRFSDFSTLKFEDYRNGFLYKKTDKIGNWVAVPLRNEAVEIFENRFKEGSFKISDVLFNRYIKEIGQLAGITQLVTFSYKKGNKDIFITKKKSQWITTHTCRRSFATNEFLQGTETMLIMKITGHKTIKDFLKYVRISHEEAAQQIQKVWAGRGSMSAFA